MYHYILTLFVVVAFAGARNIDNRIIGGEMTTIEKHPYQVSLQYYKGKHFCGGTLIKSNYVVSVGHCLFQKRFVKIVVRAGATNSIDGGTILDIKRYTVHPQFDYRTIDYDLSIMKLEQPFNTGASISPINIVPVGQRPRPGEMMTLTGWGATDINDSAGAFILRVIRIPVIDRTRCSTIYTGYNYVTDRMFCSGGESQNVVSGFKGDSGGPVVNEKHQLAGLAAWGHHLNMTRRPSVSTDLSNSDLREFIDGFMSLPNASTRVPRSL